MKKKPTLSGWLWGHAQNFLRRRVGLHEVSAPGLVDFARHHLDAHLFTWLGVGGRAPLPKGWPANVFDVIDKVVQARGGQVHIGDTTTPAFYLDRSSAMVLSSMYVVNVAFASAGGDYNSIVRLETALEDAISRECKLELNLRVKVKPLRVEIDRKDAAPVMLKEHWDRYLNNPKSSGRYFCGIESTAKGDVVVDNRLDNSNEYSCFFFGASGSGKTQALTSATLTVCATTSPEELAVIIIDPKGIDFPFDGLPHLACPIITHETDARSAVLQLAALLDARAKAKDRSASRRHVLLVVDELKYLLSLQKGNTDLEDAITNIAAMGRAWGIHLFIGSQRATNEYAPRRIHSQVPAKWIGRVISGDEARYAADTGGDCDAERLPGRGAAYLVEPDGTTRIQSAYIGRADDPTYPALVAPFISDLRNKWSGKRPHWNVDSNGPSDQPIAGAVVPSATEAATGTQPASLAADSNPVLDTLPEGVLERLEAVYEANPEKFNKQRLREVVREATGKRMKVSRETEVYNAFVAYVQE